MGPQNAGNERVRAWVLVQAAPVQGMSAKLRNLDKKKTELVVIRADVVAAASGLPYNMVVPVDAESEAVLSRVVGEIKGTPGVSDAVELKVVEYDPRPPQDASGFITDGEVRKWKGERAGRQDSSPGYNPWG